MIERETWLIRGSETERLEPDMLVLSGVHSLSECAGEHCVLHFPSDHHMRSWNLYWRDDRGIFERICEHGVGHVDPDDPTEDRTHGCDGCCYSREEDDCE